MKKISLSLFALLATAALPASAAAEPSAILEVWPGDPPGVPMKVGPKVDTTKATDRLVAGRAVVRLGNVARPQLHVYLPEPARRNGTAVIICPGGAFRILAYPAYLVDDKSLQLKPEFAVNPGAPPMFFVHAADDHVRPDNSAQLFLALRRAAVPAELHVYEQGGHGYGLRPEAKFPVTSWPERCEAWLRGRGLLESVPPRR